MAPIVPGFTTERAASKRRSAPPPSTTQRSWVSNVLHLKDGTKDHFMGFLRQEFPHLVEGYERLYPGAYAPKDYVDDSQGRG